MYPYFKANNQAVRTLGSLANKTFFIDTYQRTNLWNEKKIVDLLRDLISFQLNAEKADTYYCFQPIIGIEKSIELNGFRKDVFELVAGQQQLLSIYIILKLAEKPLFEIEYKNRAGSDKFLKNESCYDLDSKEWNEFSGSRFDNIDNFQFFETYKVISTFFKVCDKNAFVKMLLERTKVIWHEVEDVYYAIQEHRAISSRFTGEKKGLTDSNVLKSWFVQWGNDEETRSILAHWEELEMTLREPAFWYFVSADAMEGKNNAIHLLLEAVKNGSKPALNDEEKKANLFQIYQKRNIGFQHVISLFESIKIWYKNPEIYNLVGFLTHTSNIPLSQLHLEFHRVKTDSQFIEILKTKIKARYYNLALENLRYGEHTELIGEILLLFNVQAHLKKNSVSKFPFHKFKEMQWEVEHIHNVAAGKFHFLQEQLAWLKYAGAYLQEIDQNGFSNEIAEIENLLLNPDLEERQFEDFHLKLVSSLLSKDYAAEIDNTIGNLVLMPKIPNRVGSNAPYLRKRAEMIDLDLMGKYILPCTKNVFLKYYSTQSNKHLVWGLEDRQQYFEGIKASLFDFIEFRNANYKH